MKTRTFAFTVATALAGMLAFSGSGFAAKGGIPGPPDGGGGGNAPPDFGDLIILLRDIDGVPIPSLATQVPDPETGLLVDGGLCWQPIAFNVDDEACPEDCQVTITNPATVLVDQFNCGVATGCSGCTQEVDFGRINEARSPDEVFASQLEDVVVNLATSGCVVSLDPAGRMVTGKILDDTVEPVLYSTSAIDSPLQNLAIYRQLMLTGTLGAPMPGGAGTLDTAARGLGVASDKTGEVNVDLVAYLNQIMGLDEMPAILGKLCETYREEVKGQVQLVEKCFLDYSAYYYDRLTNFGALPAPAYIPEGEPEEGWFEYLALVPDTVPPTFEIMHGPIMTAVFADAEGFLDRNIGGFAQAADDARAVIDFMHNWPVPDEDEYATPVPCIASGDITYDVSISDVSGLQVPKNIVDGSSDREFIVTVAHVGGVGTAPVTVTVTAIPESGGSILADLDGDDPDAGFIPSPFVFPITDIEPETSESFSALISVDIGQRTTINWTATAAAPGDVNLTNNTVTAVSNVKVTGGGGR